jgi:hypothetical protein
MFLKRDTWARFLGSSKAEDVAVPDRNKLEAIQIPDDAWALEIYDLYVGGINDAQNIGDVSRPQNVQRYIFGSGTIMGGDLNDMKLRGWDSFALCSYAVTTHGFMPISAQGPNQSPDIFVPTSRLLARILTQTAL